MFSALLITLREGLEAALIIGIILAFLANTGNRKWFKQVWLGTGAAISTSIIAGAILFITVGAFEGRAEEIFEGSAMLLAALVLTWMIFWMRKQAANIKGQLHGEIERAISSGSSFALMGLAFIAVLREGIETALFLFAATRTSDSTLLSVVGGLIGLVIAIAIGYLVYRGTSKLNLKTFFNVTGFALILFAAGLIAHGIHDFQEARLMPIIIEHIWDVNNMLSENSTFGNFLAAVFGYNGNPSLIETVAYFGYLITVIVVFFNVFGSRRKIASISERG